MRFGALVASPSPSSCSVVNLGVFHFGSNFSVSVSAIWVPLPKGK